MPLRFNAILEENQLSPASVRLLRHKDNRSSPGRSPYELWRDDKEAFDLYQSTQLVRNRKIFSAPYWAVFVADAFDDTMFVGLYAAAYKGLIEYDQPKPQTIGEIDPAGTCDRYDLILDERMGDLIERLIIDWGDGERAWVQYADRQNKSILEIRLAQSAPLYPGHLNFIEPLSRIGKLPNRWINALRAARGVYILTCPNPHFSPHRGVAVGDGAMGDTTWLAGAISEKSAERGRLW